MSTAESTEFDVGCRVRVVGLVQAAHHNGKTGVVIASLDTQTGRIGVKLEDGAGVNVKPCNMQLLQHPDARTDQLSQLLAGMMEDPKANMDKSEELWKRVEEHKAQELKKRLPRSWESFKQAKAKELEDLQQLVDASMGFCCGTESSRKGKLTATQYAETRKSVESMSMFRWGNMKEAYKPASSDDWAYCAFNEQLQRIAGQLATMIEGVIHGDPYTILDQFSKAWDRFLQVYKDIIRLIVGWALEADPEDSKYANPETDFRVLGIKVFRDAIFARYQSKMFYAVRCIIEAGLTEHYPSIKSCDDCLIAMVDVSSCFSRARFPNETWSWPGPRANELPRVVHQAGLNVKPVKNPLLLSEEWGAVVKHQLKLKNEKEYPSILAQLLRGDAAGGGSAAGGT